MAVCAVPKVLGRVKSFSQKSGWGFIQLFDDGNEESENCKDVFFHRADVARSGSCELRPGLLVQCDVVVTGKGEKASNIQVVEGEDKSMPRCSSSTMTCLTCFDSSEDSLSHAPYRSELSTVLSTDSSLNSTQSLFSLRSTDNYTFWRCGDCQAQNAAKSIQRVVVVCATCGTGHRVQHWLCACSRANPRGTRHCTFCDMPYALGCQELQVQVGRNADSEAAEETPAIVALANRRVQRARSRWQHTATGWDHPSIVAPAASTWLQDGAAPLNRHQFERRQETMFEKCRSRLSWACDWLQKGSPAGNMCKEWLYGVSKLIAQPEHKLLCTARGSAAFVPNPCASVEEPDVQHMYEAIGMLLALAVANQQQLYPKLPLWMARSLLGYPTSLQDLEEFDPALRHKADSITADTSSDRLQTAFQETITCNGVTRTYELEDGEKTWTTYATWLKDVYLVKSVEVQLKHIKHGFFYALMGDHLMQGVTPRDFAAIVNGETVEATMKQPATLVDFAHAGWI